MLESANRCTAQIDRLFLGHRQNQLRSNVRGEEIADIHFRNGLVIDRQAQTRAIFVGHVEVHSARTHHPGAFARGLRHGGSDRASSQYSCNDGLFFHVDFPYERRAFCSVLLKVSTTCTRLRFVKCPRTAACNRTRTCDGSNPSKCLHRSVRFTTDARSPLWQHSGSSCRNGWQAHHR